MARRATLIKQHLPETDFSLFVDAGGFNRGVGETSILQTEYLFKAMAEIGCKTFNLSKRDFVNGGQALEKIAKENDIDLLASNTIYKDSEKNWVKPYQIIKINAMNDNDLPFSKLSIGVVGLTDESGMMFSRRLKEDMLCSKPPLDVAKSVIPKVRDKADLVVLLYHGNYKHLKEILDTVKGIDVAILGGQYYMINDLDMFDAIIASTSSMGKYCGILTLTLDAHKKIIKHEKQSIALKEDVPDDPDMDELLKEFDKKNTELQQRLFSDPVD